jgi:hypothetical protein
MVMKLKSKVLFEVRETMPAGLSYEYSSFCAKQKPQTSILEC